MLRAYDVIYHDGEDVYLGATIRSTRWQECTSENNGIVIWQDSSFMMSSSKQYSSHYVVQVSLQHHGIIPSEALLLRFLQSKLQHPCLHMCHSCC